MIRTFLAIIALLGIVSTTSAGIKFRNITACYGVNGPVRESLEAYPGDEIVFRYVIDGLQAGADGKIDGTLSLKIVDEADKVIFDKPTALNGLLQFGGSTLPGFANLNLGPKMQPGKYKMIATFTDNTQHQSVSFERAIICRKPEFAIIKPRFSYDSHGESSASLNAMIGQQIFYTLIASGFDRSQNKIDLALSLQFLDEKGNELMPNSIVIRESSDDPKVVEKNEFVSFKSVMVCNRVGAFKLRLTLRDNITKKTATFEAPVKVSE